MEKRLRPSSCSAPALQAHLLGEAPGGQGGGAGGGQAASARSRASAASRLATAALVGARQQAQDADRRRAAGRR